MHTIFSITVEDIRLLDDAQARELVARLCRAELKSLGASQSGVTWGGDQRAMDGGVDVRVDSESHPPAHGYLFNGKVGFQVKAEKFGPAKISSEMAPKNRIRDAILGLAELSGAYVIVSTRDSLSDTSLKLRTDAMRNCLNSFGIANTLAVDFYDARKIADWAESHPAISNWVKSQIGKPNVGWRAYGPWAYHESSVKAEYLIDDRVKVFTPNQDDGLAITKAIDQLRADLSRPSSVRIVGLSGVGKTRLAQALFDPRIQTPSAPLDDENVIYADLADNPTPQPSAMLEALVGSESDCVVVLDNCGPETHQRLTEIAKRARSKTKLLTIEYDIRDDLPEATIVYRLDGSSDDVVKSLLKRKYSFLSSLDLQNIADFSDGNARVAFALASTASTSGEIGRLRDDLLFKRLFHQNNVENDELLRCAEVLSLVYSFNGDDTGETSELVPLAALLETTVSSLQRKISELQRRGLLQYRGPWRAVLPHAIANRLAARALADVSIDAADRAFCETGNDRIAKSFSRRLGYLHNSVEAQKLSMAWLAPKGKLGDISKLSELGRQVFANVAAVSQNEALESIERAVVFPSFVSVENQNRNQFARVAMSIAYEAEFFERAVDVLVKFAVAETEDYNREPVAKQLASLFQIHLSGTHASPEQRCAAIRKLLASDDEKLVSIGIRLLDAALEASHFSTINVFDFGALKRDFGWRPKTRKEERDWFRKFIELATELGNSNSSQHATQARAVLGKSVRGLVTYAGTLEFLTEAAEKLNSHRAWHEGWLGIRRVITWDKAKISAPDLADVLRLERFLAPTNLKDRITAKVLAKGAFAHDMEDEAFAGETESATIRYAKVYEEAEELGALAAAETGLVDDLISDLLDAGSNSKVLNFGNGVAKEYDNVQLLLEKIRLHISQLGEKRFSPLFVRGLIAGWICVDRDAVNRFMELAITDEVWKPWFVELQVRADLDEAAFGRIIRSIELGYVPAGQYSYLAMERATEPLTVGQISDLVSSIAKLQGGGLKIAIDLLGMVIHGSNEKSQQYRRELANACEQFISDIDWQMYPEADHLTDYDMGVVLNFTLSDATFSPNIAKTLGSLIDRSKTPLQNYVRNRGQLLAPFFLNFPMQALDAIYGPIPESNFYSVLQLVSDPYRENSETAIRKVPTEKLIEWCNKSPDDRYIFAAHACRLFSKLVEGAVPGEIQLTPTAIQILERAPNPRAILEVFVDRFQPRFWSGPLANILESRLPLLQSLNPNNNSELQADINNAKMKLQEQIFIERKRDDDHERSRTGSFEE